MRYVVTFAHRKYSAIQDALWRGDTEYKIPEGLYRQLAVVVEADNQAHAVDAALRSLGWPDDEMDLIPMGVASQDEVAAAVRNGPRPEPAPA